MKKYLLALLLVLPSIAFSSNLDNFYITAKGGISNTSDTGTTNQTDDRGFSGTYENEDLGAGTAFGFSMGKYLSDSLRLELEATKRTGYEFDARDTDRSFGLDQREKAKLQTEALFINGFYDFQSFIMSNTAITPYLGGGVGISRNKMGTVVLHNNRVPNGVTSNGDNTNQFAYKLSAGILVSLTQQLSLDVNYQYVDLGAFNGGTERINTDETTSIYQRGLNGGDIKTHELMVGLQYKF